MIFSTIAPLGERNRLASISIYLRNFKIPNSSDACSLLTVFTRLLNAGSQFLDTGDQRKRLKTAGNKSFHLSGSSNVSKWDDEDKEYAANASRAVSERDLDDMPVGDHDEGRCVVCQDLPEITAKYGVPCYYRSSFSSEYSQNRRQFLNLVHDHGNWPFSNEFCSVSNEFVLSVMNDVPD
jgi:hypothetical protein